MSPALPDATLNPVARPAPLPVLALAIFAANMGLGIIFPLIPHLAAGSQGGAAAVGGIFASYAAALVFSEVVGGALADRLDTSRLLVGALALYFLTLLAFTVARGVPMLMGVRAFEGLAIGLVVPCVMKLVVRSVPPERLGRGIGTVMGLGGMGFIAGPLIGGQLAPIGLPLPFLCAAAVAGIAACASVVWLPPTPAVEGPAPLGAIARTELAAFWRRLTDAGFFGLVLPLLAVKAVFATMQAVLPLFGERVLGADMAHVSYLFVVTAIAYGIVQPLAGRLADRFPIYRLVAAAFVLMAALLAVMAMQRDYLAFLVPYAVFSLAQCGSVLFAMKAVGEGLGETAQGRAFGLASAIGDLGMIVAPAALMPAFAWRHEAVFWGLAVLLVVCGLGARLLYFGRVSRPAATPLVEAPNEAL